MMGVLMHLVVYACQNSVGGYLVVLVTCKLPSGVNIETADVLFYISTGAYAATKKSKMSIFHSLVFRKIVIIKDFLPASFCLLLMLACYGMLTGIYGMF